MPQKAKKRKTRVVVDTSMLVAGVSGFKETYTPGKNPSADVLHKWAEEHNFVWLVSEDILDEYKELLKRLRVRSHLIGRIVNLIRERADDVKVRCSVEISPDPGDDPFCLCAEQGKADFILTLNPTDFPQDRLKATVVSPDRFLSGARPSSQKLGEFVHFKALFLAGDVAGNKFDGLLEITPGAESDRQELIRSTDESLEDLSDAAMSTIHGGRRIFRRLVRRLNRSRGTNARVGRDPQVAELIALRRL